MELQERVVFLEQQLALEKAKARQLKSSIFLHPWPVQLLFTGLTFATAGPDSPRRFLRGSSHTMPLLRYAQQQPYMLRACCSQGRRLESAAHANMQRL